MNITATSLSLACVFSILTTPVTMGDILSVIETSTLKPVGSSVTSAAVQTLSIYPGGEGNSWNRIYIRDGSDRILLDLLYCTLPDLPTAEKEFLMQQRLESTGGKAPPFKIGDSSITIGARRILVIRGKTVFWLNWSEDITQPWIESLSQKIDQGFATPSEQRHESGT